MTVKHNGHTKSTCWRLRIHHSRTIEFDLPYLFLLFFLSNVSCTTQVAQFNLSSEEAYCNRSRTILSATHGFISDGPANYTQDSHCEWLISSSSPGQIITLFVHQMRTECSYDYLFIFDGKSYRDSKFLASLSGDSTPLIPFSAYSGHMLLLLYSDTNYALEGFTAEYFISRCPLKDCPDWKLCNGTSDNCPCLSSQVDDSTECTFEKDSFTSDKDLGRVGHSAVQIEESVYIYGGFNLNIILDNVVIFNLTSEIITSVFTNSQEVFPSGRYGHAHSSYGHGFYVHGGRTLERISNELWYFNIGRREWKKYESEHFPYLLYHTMTKTPEDIFYVYGGGYPDGAFSAKLFKFSGENPTEWEIIESPCCGKAKERSLLGHTMTFWKEKNALLVFGGFESFEPRFSKLANQLWMYSIDSKHWTPIKFTSSSDRALALHTSTIIGNYLVIAGGYTHSHNIDESCFSNHIIVYNLNCHVVSDNPVGQELDGIFGHQSVLWKDSLYIIFGYRGYIVGNVTKVNVSKLRGTGCSSLERWKCTSNPSCGWCPNDEKCYERSEGSKICTTNLQISQCPGLCPLLKSCDSCTLTWSCNYCESTGECFSTEDLAVSCPVESIRKTQSSCILKDSDRQRQVVTLFEYKSPVDTACPDAVRYLNSTAFIIPRSDDRSVTYIMKGVLVENTSPLSKLELCVHHVPAQLKMELINRFGDNSKEEETLTVSLAQSNAQNCVNLNWSSGLPVTLLPGSKIKFELVANSTRNMLAHEKYGSVSLRRHASKVFRKDNIQPFGSNGELCGDYSNCLNCLGDVSCLYTNEKCFSRNVWSENEILITPLVANLEDCSVCQDYITCKSCLAADGCEWSEEDAICLRPGRLLIPVKNSLSCLPDCYSRTNCSTCLDVPGSCVWCQEKQECFPFSVYTSYYQYGQCFHWKDKSIQCQECSTQTSCKDCLIVKSCGWSYNDSGGTCAEGDFAGPYGEGLQLQMDIDNKNWTYHMCPDIDECALEIDDCHVNADCINTPGLYICQCKRGFTGNGKALCEKTCYEKCVHGRCSENFVCECDLGWTGVDCSIDCGCFQHGTCENGFCENCQENTFGEFCELCVSGSFGNATTVGCQLCQCNGHGDPQKQICDNLGICFCKNHTTGKDCSQCESGFYGNPQNGQNCYRDCSGRSILQADAGYFGAEGKREGKAITRRTEEHCLWIIKLPSKEEPNSYPKRSRGIKIKIFSNFHIPCLENVLKVYSGLPSFSRNVKEVPLIASICTFSHEETSNAVEVNVEGHLVSVLLQYAIGSHQDIRFNASFDLNLSPSASPTHSNLPIEINQLSHLHSVLPRFGHSLFSNSESIWIFGGYSFSHGILNDIRQFRRDIGQWTAVIIIANNEESVPRPRYFHAGVLGLNSEIFIHGGITNNLTFLSDTWRFETRRGQWKRLTRDSIPPLAGHCMALQTDEDSKNGDFLVIIGGFNVFNGFSNKVFRIPCNGATHYEEVNTTGSAPVGIYGHSCVYHNISKTFYVFGGVIYERDEVIVTNKLYALHWPTKKWTYLPPIQENQVLKILPSARFLHNAVVTNDYMVVIGGSGSSKNLSVLAYHFKCDLWTLVGNDVNMERSASGCSIERSDVFSLGGWNGSENLEKLIRLRLPQDICSIHNSSEHCKSTIGCSFCKINKDPFHQCYDSAKEMPQKCSGSNIEFWKGTICSREFLETRNCSQFNTCSDCLSFFPIHQNLAQGCTWCMGCHGRCIEFGKRCQEEHSCANQKQREVVESSYCPERSCASAECEKCISSSEKCIWTRQILRSNEWSFQLHSHPVYDWNCVRKSVLDSSTSFVVMSSPPAICPAKCAHYSNCKECLSAEGAEGGFKECHWSVSLNKCISPAHKWIICFAGICGPTLKGSTLSCPKPCSALTSCNSCLTHPNCGWCATENQNGLGTCTEGDSFSPDSSTICLNSVWNYLSCPKENECINDHHTCDTTSEQCTDLAEGFKCECREGFEKSEDSVCKPVCSQGCLHGDCVRPAECACHFGYVGINCTAQCKCNSHSECTADALDLCLDCRNNTTGDHCSRCKPLFVGDPKNGGSCISCDEYCNGHSEVCLSLEGYQKWCNNSGDMTESQIRAKVLSSNESEFGPLNRAYCCSCKKDSKSIGEKCDDCLPGYFRGTEDKRSKCRKCQCNYHGNVCDSSTGLDCNCSNNTESSTDHCSQGIIKQGAQHCWKYQCSKCRELYLGTPINGHQCFRQMHVDTDYCLDPKSQESCPMKPKPLLSGRTIFFAVQPKFMNVNIRVNLDITHGAAHVYLSPKEDTFIVRNDQNSWMHVVEFDKKYRISGDGERDGDAEVFEDNVTHTSVLSHAFLAGESFQLRELEAAGFSTYVIMDKPKEILVVRNLRNRLTITLPQEYHDLRVTRFYMLIQGIGDVSFGNIFFRQDQLHIDLFVFFSVFFSAFFLFLAACGIAWKLKQNVDSRRARHRHAAQILQMSKRPFAVWTLILEPDTSSPLYHVYTQCRKACRRGCVCLRPLAVEPMQEGSCAVCTMFVSLPGGLSRTPVRLALASCLANLQSQHHHVVRRRRL